MSPGNSLEDLVVENRRTYSPELTAARAQPRDYDATADLKKDSDRLDRLAELADVEPARIVDVAVRGVNVTFQVAEALTDDGQPTGAVSSGFFPLAALDSGSSKAARRARSRGTVAHRPDPTRADAPGAVGHGTATVATVATTGGEEQDPEDDPPVTPPEGVPLAVAKREVNAKDTISLLKEPPEGVNPRAVAAYERDRPEDEQRKSVITAAERLGLYEGEGA